jgi:hypothetical protein
LPGHPETGISAGAILGLAVLPNIEVVRSEPSHRSSLAIGHHGVDLHQIYFDVDNQVRWVLSREYSANQD